ncbi:AMP-binding protein [Aeromicrobium alkaliterrae]|uniref:Acyl--CoA ligase family protein n=1 Tax=Aeromicrobium alkaliterrae TaxID=302168 RepID=A0ABP4VPP2_9ACTN
MAEFTFSPLSPSAFLPRAAAAFGERTAVVDGDQRWTYAQLADRCARLASVLRDATRATGVRVAALCSNSHVMIELHQAAPAAGVVLVSVNTRLSLPEMQYILEHSGSTVLVVTHEHAERGRELTADTDVRLVVAGGADDDYESLLAEAAPLAEPVAVDERDLLAINYTSGTTGRPKGVMYHHRGAYLQAVAMAFHAGLTPGSRYLWTLPMFHCNGWSFPWAVTAAGGTHVCLREIDPGHIWQLLRDEGVTHYSAAPTVLTMIAEDASAAPLDGRVHVDTGGSPPSPALLERLVPLGFDVTHLYGLTETFGPVAINVWQPEWDDLDERAASALRARQGIGNITSRPLRVLTEDGADVPADGASMGEIAVSGNNVMLGYYRDDEATLGATRSGCFLTGDIGVMHPDGYVEIRDRGKDIIISGGENIASIEIEQALDSHPDVVMSSVVGVPDDRWGELPVAFVTRRSGSTATEEELRDHVRGHLARFKVPKSVVFADLPRTSTGKVQKNLLREQARGLSA